MKKLIAKILAGLTLALSLGVFASCGKNEKIIYIPSDGSNCTRALFLLEQEGYITLRSGVSPEDSLSDLDIKDDNGYTIKLLEASTIPAQLKNAPKGTLAVINGNYAIAAGLRIQDAIATENASGAAASLYANIVAVQSGKENSEKTQVLMYALRTAAVYDFIVSEFGGAVLPVFEKNTDLQPPTVSGSGKIKVGASSTPHALILEEVVASIVSSLGYTLEVETMDDYVIPNTALADGDLDANYFQHLPYLNLFNQSNGTSLVSAGAVHYEPFGLYDTSACK